jgi:hypothetical protein
MRNGRSMPIEGKTTTLSYVGITFAVVRGPNEVQTSRTLNAVFFSFFSFFSRFNLSL